jgi:hypothetical protein
MRTVTIAVTAESTEGEPASIPSASIVILPLVP